MTKHRFKTSPFWAIAVAAALGMGLSACGGGSSNDGLSAAEEDALRQQVADAEAAKDQAEADKNKAEADKKALEDANTTAMNAANRAAMVAKGKALYSKLTYTSDGAFVSGNLNITPGEDDSLTGLKKQDTAVAALGGWMGAHYMKALPKPSTVTAEARVYSNPSAAKSVSALDDEKGLDAQTGLTRGTDQGQRNTYTVAADSYKQVMLNGLASSGTTTYEDEDEVKGSFAGATGTYMCGANCTAAPVNTGGVTFAGTWTFVPDPGATVKDPDTTYLYFGWWVRQNKDGPTAASAFYGQQPIAAATGALATSDGGSLSGTAEYMGKAAGKFAINYGDTANAGHFTADAMLNAKFGTGATDGLSGTIDNFRLNDGSDNPGWSISLKRADWEGDSATDMYRKMGTSGSPATEWSIGSNDPVPGQMGQWEAQMFDETGKDNNDSPTTVVGKFEAGFGGTHKMVGAFGASQQ